MISEVDLQQIMPKLSASLRQLYLPFLNRTMEIYQIDTPLRIAAYLAQIAHESGELKYMEEIWGPTAQQLRYEPPGSLADRLGNTQPGDGFRFKGRGPIQITGRFNYNKYGNLLGIDLVSNPEIAASPQIAFSIAGLYWQSNGLNQLADVEDFREITRRINGGYNGYEDRLRYYRMARQVLGIDTSFTLFAGIHSEDSAIVEASGSSAAPAVPNSLPRGQEAISESASEKPPRKKTSSPAPPKTASKKKKTITKPAAKKTSSTAPKTPAAKAKKASSSKPATKNAAKKALKKAVKKPVKKAGPAKKASGAKKK